MFLSNLPTGNSAQIGKSIFSPIVGTHATLNRFMKLHHFHQTILGQNIGITFIWAADDNVLKSRSGRIVFSELLTNTKKRDWVSIIWGHKLPDSIPELQIIFHQWTNNAPPVPSQQSFPAEPTTYPVDSRELISPSHRRKEWKWAVRCQWWFWDGGSKHDRVCRRSSRWCGLRCHRWILGRFAFGTWCVDGIPPVWILFLWISCKWSECGRMKWRVVWLTLTELFGAYLPQDKNNNF